MYQTIAMADQDITLTPTLSACCLAAFCLSGLPFKSRHLHCLEGPCFCHMAILVPLLLQVLR